MLISQTSRRALLRAAITLPFLSGALPAVAQTPAPTEAASPIQPGAAAPGTSSAPEQAPAGEGAPEASTPAAPRQPARPVPIRAEAKGWDGAAIPLLADGETAGIPPEASFSLSSDHALVDLRIRLFDEAGKLVPARDRATIGKGTLYESRPEAPLVTGSRYRIQIDGQQGLFPKDVEGETYAPQEFTILTTGEKPPPPPPQPARSRGRRR